MLTNGELINKAWLGQICWHSLLVFSHEQTEGENLIEYREERRIFRKDYLFTAHQIMNLSISLKCKNGNDLSLIGDKSSQDTSYYLYKKESSWRNCVTSSVIFFFLTSSHEAIVYRKKNVFSLMCWTRSK